MGKYTRSCLLWLGASFILALAGATPALAKLQHFIVIVMDDVGVDQLSCYGEGSDTPATPQICKHLASRGLLFRNVWANPTCSPTRSTVQTGRYAFRTGVFAPGVALPLGELTIPEILDDADLGYATAVFGKWHLSGTNFDNPPTCSVPGTPIDHGYDYFAGTRSNVTDYVNWCRIVADGSSVTSGVCGPGGPFSECKKQPYATIVNVNDALAWIKDHDGPWFVWMAFNAPHSPYQAPPTNCPGGPCHGQNLPVKPGVACPPGQKRACYKAMLETLDHEVGRLVQDLPPDTTIVLMGDNGTPTEVTVAPFNPAHAKFTVYEGGINVPLIIASPVLGENEGTTSDLLVNATDLFATVLQLAGASLPEDLVHDSQQLVDVLFGSPQHREYVFSERNSPPTAAYEKVARDARFKLLVRPNTTMVNAIELYDLEGSPKAFPPQPADPFETMDLYNDANPQLNAVQQAHFDALMLYLDDLADGP
jgi:arylsulfatase B